MQFRTFMLRVITAHGPTIQCTEHPKRIEDHRCKATKTTNMTYNIDADGAHTQSESFDRYNKNTIQFDA